MGIGEKIIILVHATVDLALKKMVTSRFADL
jgi:hypothetical protein